jgi:REP element-mobilizing transposase RayT
MRYWDYSSAGWYFVTCVTWDRQRMLAEVRGGRMCLTRAGQATTLAWQAIPVHFPGVGIDAFVVMPDHVHGIVRLNDLRWSDRRAVPRPLPESGQARPSLNAIVGSWKAASSRAIRRDETNAPPRIWQRSYHEWMIRSDAMLDGVRRYIERNPARWIASRTP